MIVKPKALAAALAVAASTAFAQPPARTTQKPNGQDCNKPEATQQVKEEPGFWDKAVDLGGKIAGEVAGAVVSDATRGLGDKAGKAVRDASGNMAKHTGEVQRQARNATSQAGRTVADTAKAGTRGAVSSAKDAFKDCDTTTAPKAPSAPTTDASQTSAEIDAVKNAAGAAAETVGGWFKKLKDSAAPAGPGQ